MMVRSAHVRCNGRGQSGTRPRFGWQWLLWLALLCVASGCSPAAGLLFLPSSSSAGLRPVSIRAVECEELWCMDLTDSLQPTLRWEAFPRPEDLEADKAGRLATVRNPTYELRIWQVKDGRPPELVYARSGLPEPVHTVETVLTPDTDYLWTIRARFQINGEPRVTEWGGWKGLREREAEIHYPPRFYRFTTPRR